jgi:hypothetical protein
VAGWQWRPGWPVSGNALCSINGVRISIFEAKHAAIRRAEGRYRTLPALPLLLQREICARG